MVDPFAELVLLLQPEAPFSKYVTGAGRWRVRRVEAGRPFFCLVLEGGCRLALADRDPILLQQDDFVLIPAARDFTVFGLQEGSEDAEASSAVPRDGEIRHGVQDGLPEVRMLVGYCAFGSPDATLLVSLLPALVHVRGDARLGAIAQLVGDEFRAARPAREVLLAKLLEVLLIEALRTGAHHADAPGLLRGLADARLGAARRRLHEDPARAWTVGELAREAALSRSTFFERFSRALGVAPMEYLFNWRMAMARSLLRENRGGVAEVAQQVGYGSASAFSVAFARHVGVPPARYAQGASAAV
ncbi:AraC family transcriptional regulator [Massilia sp. IC2-477]|uniref:helix-turn-helix transcriptional regulator n=1 Tax=Massilia sp. IC2-477 TaxID=2887198 RepID=UPI001D11CB14|nr:AraC family transcriptional regulator [Massilia sp. IC2-477]MCC2957796.1 AraC family transcriptional regulator [Massilia sp. IC2-477]